MKNSFVSRAALLGIAAWLEGATQRAAWAASPAHDGLACLERADLACAERAADKAGASSEAQLLQARVAFHRADFALARTRLEGVKLPAREELEQEVALYRRTEEATRGFQLVTRDGVEVRFAPGVDRILVDASIEVLVAARSRVGARLGGAPPGPIRVEIYPTARSFIAASSLPAEAVQTTGVIALSKWNRLLLTSPRALGRGYPWKDTLAHEYLHEVVAWRTGDRAPVWLQEGIARSHEALWSRDTFAPLAPLARSLLGGALANDSLVPLQRMHPSMAFLSSAEEASLAYAQVDTMLQFLEQRAGAGGVSRLLDEVRDGEDAHVAWAKVLGGTPDSAMADWRAWLRTLGLEDRGLASSPTVLGAQDDAFGADPVLAKRKDLAGFARLGDLLADKNRPEAALVEYDKAMPTDEPTSPALVVRRARVLVRLKRRDEALASLRASVADYPEEAESRRALADMEREDGRADAAIAQYEAALDIYPFDTETQTRLAELLAARGETSRAEQHLRQRRILETGGDDLPIGASR